MRATSSSLGDDVVRASPFSSFLETSAFVGIRSLASLCP